MKKLALVVFLALMIICTGSVYAAGQDDTTENTGTEIGWEDYNGKRIGVLTGTLMEDAATTYFPDSEYFYFNSYQDCNAALDDFARIPEYKVCAVRIEKIG